MVCEIAAGNLFPWRVFTARCCEWRKKEGAQNLMRFQMLTILFQEWQCGGVPVTSLCVIERRKGKAQRPAICGAKKQSPNLILQKESLYNNLKCDWTGQTGDPQSFSGDDRWFAWLLGHGNGEVLPSLGSPVTSEVTTFRVLQEDPEQSANLWHVRRINFDIEFRNDVVHFSVVFLKIFHGSMMVWT